VLPFDEEISKTIKQFSSEKNKDIEEKIKEFEMRIKQV
jgi:hypothetical protein